MDLFVVNRYAEDNENDTKDEQAKLHKLLKKIKKNKIKRQEQRLKEKIKKLDENIEPEKNKYLCEKIKRKIRKLQTTETEVTTQEQTKKIEDVCEKDDLNNVENGLPVDEITEDLENDEPKPDHKIPAPIDIEGFTILGTDKFEKKKIVKRVLPKWLRNPTVISSNLKNLNKKISRSEFNSNLKNKLKEKKIKYLFPVQAEFIPWELNSTKCSDLISPPDACVSAPTGSGKTLAFTIPVLQYLIQKLENRSMTLRAVRALIILPTQSLALQIFDTLKYFSTDTGIEVGIATGSGEHSLESEQKQLVSVNSVWGASSKVDVLVCTAGRLVDHLKSSKDFDLRHLQYVIIDEADRVLDSVQADWLYHLGIHLRIDDPNFLSRNILNLQSVKKRTDPQKLLFSATLSQDPEKLQKLSLFQPKLFTCVTDNDNTITPDSDRFIGKYTTPDELSEKYVLCTIDTKPLILYKLILDELNKNKSARILVFTNTADTLHRINLLLGYMSQGAFAVAEISSSRSNLEARKTLIKKFEDGTIQVLVCTDSMARGIDVPNVDCVISYSMPNQLKTYIHRAGRTARAGSKGLCVSMLHPKQQTHFLKMIENMRSHTNAVEHMDVTQDELETFAPVYENSLTQLKERLNYEIQYNVSSVKSKKRAIGKKRFTKRNVQK